MGSQDVKRSIFKAIEEVSYIITLIKSQLLIMITGHLLHSGLWKLHKAPFSCVIMTPVIFAITLDSIRFSVINPYCEPTIF